MAIDLHGKHGAGVKETTKLILDDFANHQCAHTFETTTRRSGTGSDEHQYRQNHPGQMGPRTHMVAENARSGHKRHHLEGGAPDGVFQIVALMAHEDNGDP